MSLIKNNNTNNFYPTRVEGTDWHCDYLWSTYKGNFNGAGCEHGCIYCSRDRYNNRFKIPHGLRRLNSEWAIFDGNDYLKRRLPEGGIFVNPYSDVMTFPKEDIEKILWHCNYEKSYLGEERTFIFQTKDPAKYFDYLDIIPECNWLGTTIETNYWEGYELYSGAPNPGQRYNSMADLKFQNGNKFRYFVTIEPIMQFAENLIYWMEKLNPDLIFIGANISRIQLPEPSYDELIDFIYVLFDSIGVEKVYLKSNVRRLIPAFYDGWLLAKEQNERAISKDL